MYELEITVKKIMGVCTSDPPCERVATFRVRDGNIRVPKWGSICLWALQSMLPVITPKERKIAEDQDQDWMWRVHHIQCPDPKGRVIYKIDRVREIDKRKASAETSQESVDIISDESFKGMEEGVSGLRNLRIVVEEIKGTCTSGLMVGDYFFLRGGRLYIPHQRHFCLYALHAVLPLLPAKQRPLEEGDWLLEDSHVICPDPAGNVIMRIEVLP